MLPAAAAVTPCSCLALGSCLAVATSTLQLRLFSLGGVQLGVSRLAGPPIALAAQVSVLCAVLRGSTGSGSWSVAAS
jgi:hypothetical protein